ncbi:MAG: peptidyl-prolyl cis-trans isomerase [Sandaracinaceae bacterium]|nr:peptidyl-prolyl cis-trans isomerase [Sandaracinaceae bacterium]
MSEPSAPSRAVGLLREPLLHFTLAGLVIFGVDAARRGEEAPEHVVVVDAPIRAELAERLQTQLGEAPSEEAIERAVDEWTRDEILYREGVERGFDAHDPAVRARVATRMARVLREGVVVPEPTDAELRAFFDEAPERWAEPGRVDFTHVFVDGQGPEAEARADELAAVLAAGASPAGLGDRFSGGRRYRRRALEDLAQSFGPEFVEGLADQPIGAWVRRRSRLGLHLVRVEAHEAPRAPRFEAVAGDVRHELARAREDAAFEEAVRRLVARWEIVRGP